MNESDRPLRILYHHRIQGRGAEGVHISSIVTELRAMGHEVMVVSPPGIDPLSHKDHTPVDKGQVQTRSVQSIWKVVSRHLPNLLFELAEIAYNLLAYRRLSSLLASQKFDLIYERYAFYLIAGAVLARRRGVPFVLEANEVSGVGNRARRQSVPRLCAWFERFLFDRCAAIHTVSSELKRMIERQGVAGASIHVVPNAFDVTKLNTTGKRQDLLQRHKLHDRLVIGFADWFDHWDPLDFFLEAFRELRQTHPSLALLLIGDGPVLKDIRGLMARHQLENDVLLTGAVSRQEIYDHLALLDIAVLPHSNNFGSPVVMFEFMGLRIPVVAPALPPILDMHADGDTALIFPPLELRACVEAVDRLIRSPTLRVQLAERAYGKLVREHTWKRNAERILEVVQPSTHRSRSDEDRCRVCVVSELPPPPGGMAVQAHLISESLRHHGHAVFNVRTNSLSHGSRLRHIKWVRGLINLSLYLGGLARGCYRASVVHIFSHSYLSFFLFTVPAVAVAKLLGRRIIVHYHGGAAEEFLRKWHRLALPTLSSAHEVLVPSRFLSEVFQAYGLRVVEIPNILEFGRFVFRERLPLRPRIIIARHLEPEYNVACGIRAFSLLKSSYPEAELVVAGDGSEQPALKKLCDELGIGASVRFLGNVSHEHMPQLYDEADIFLNSSRVDNQPVSILEAFACGLPVISTAVGGIPFMVTHMRDGLLAADNDAEALASLLMKALDDRGLCTTLVYNGRARIAEHGWANLYGQLLRVYEGTDGTRLSIDVCSIEH